MPPCLDIHSAQLTQDLSPLSELHHSSGQYLHMQLGEVMSLDSQACLSPKRSAVTRDTGETPHLSTCPRWDTHRAQQMWDLSTLLEPHLPSSLKFHARQIKALPPLSHTPQPACVPNDLLFQLHRRNP